MNEPEDLLAEVIPIDENGFGYKPVQKFIPVLVLDHEAAVIFQDTDNRYWKLAASEWDGMDGDGVRPFPVVIVDAATP